MAEQSHRVFSAAEQADIDFGQAEARCIAGEQYVARCYQGQPGSECRAIDRADHRDAALGNRVEGLACPAAVLPPLARRGVGPRPSFDVDTRGEALPGAGQDGGSNFFEIAESIEHSGEVVEHAGVEGVHRGAVQRDDRDVFGDVAPDGFGISLGSAGRVGSVRHDIVNIWNY